MPAEPDASAMMERVGAVAYPVRESGGSSGPIWARRVRSRRRSISIAQYPTDNIVHMKARLDCNWVQALEGVIDSSHTNYLHGDTFKPAADSYPRPIAVIRCWSIVRPATASRATRSRIRITAPLCGDPQADRRRGQEHHVRVTLFVAPFYGLFPGQEGWGSVQAFVPIDDTHTMLYFTRYNMRGPVSAQERERHFAWSGFVPGVDVDAEGRKFRNRANDWLQDRKAMQAGKSMSGIRGVQMEDAVVQESMGPIYDRRKEHLGVSDMAVVRMRRLMLNRCATSRKAARRRSACSGR